MLMLSRLINTACFISVTIIFIIIVTPQTGKANQKASDYYNNLTPQSLIKFLHESRHEREALSIRNSLLGHKAPPIHIKEWLRKQPDISEWPTGKLTILYFCNIECGPCIASIPKNNTLVEWITGKGGLFVSVHSASKERSAISKFFGKNTIVHPVAVDSSSSQVCYFYSKTFKEYGINATPEYVTIGKSGRVLSYKRLSTQVLSRLIDNEPNQIDATQAEAEIWTLVSIPKSWVASGLNPNSKIHNKFLVYLPDTPELILQKTQTGDATIMNDLTRHTEQGQTVYEVVLHGNTPDWGQIIEGEITFDGLFDSGKQRVSIPYKIRSRALVEYPSPMVHFGLTNKGQKLTRKITMRPDKKQNAIRLKIISTPPNIRLEVDYPTGKKDEIIVKLTFSSDQSGLHKDTIKLFAIDYQGNKQPIKLEYFALVR